MKAVSASSTDIRGTDACLIAGLDQRRELCHPCPVQAARSFGPSGYLKTLAGWGR